MRFALMIPPQLGLSYEDQLTIARRAESDGYETLFRSDHYQSFPGPSGQTATDAWTVLAGLARETSRIGLGSLMTPVTFRQPGNLAKVITTVDQMSGGRIEVALGAGWHEGEHRELGLPFPPIEDRADMLEENLAMLHGLWGEPDGWSFHGRFVTVEHAQFYPKPVDVPRRPRGSNGHARPHILVGGEGSPRSMRIAARYGDEFNLTASSPARARRKFAALADICSAVGRRADTMTRSVMVRVLIGRTEKEVEARKATLISNFGVGSGEDWTDGRDTRWILGTPDQARATVARYEAAGAQRIMLQDYLPRDLDMIDLMAEALF